MTTPSQRAMLTLDVLDDLAHLRHGFFTRNGGVSDGVFASLNCGFGSGDEPDKVAENRRRAMARLDLAPDRLTTAYQVHSAKVAVVEAPWTRDRAPRVDALVTAVPNLALGVLTADCAPVLLADAEAGVVGAAHAGWRGALGGILEAAVEAMESLGARRTRLIAGIGPTIGRDSYEVGSEFPAPFLAADPEAGSLFRPAPRAGHFLFDLPGFVAGRLARLGLARVEAMDRDTCAEDGWFFSYRRACLRHEADYGRGLSAIFLAG